MQVLETARLRLRPLTQDDAEFIFELLNDADWIRFIGDRKVRSVEDAAAYIVKGPIAMYERHGVGSLAVELREGGPPLGICGLIKRDTLEHMDIGFAFLPRHRAHGYAFEAAAACMEHGREVLGQERIVAIVSADNTGSTRLLEKLGMHFEKTVTMPNDTEELLLYAT